MAHKIILILMFMLTFLSLSACALEQDIDIQWVHPLSESVPPDVCDTSGPDNSVAPTNLVGYTILWTDQANPAVTNQLSVGAVTNATLVLTAGRTYDIWGLSNYEFVDGSTTTTVTSANGCSFSHTVEYPTLSPPMKMKLSMQGGIAVIVEDTPMKDFAALPVEQRKELKDAWKLFSWEGW